MRKGVDELRSIVEQVLKRNPNEGHLFVFVGKRCDMVKILFWDKTSTSSASSAVDSSCRSSTRSA